MSRTFGWIQDGGSFANLKRVINAIIPDSHLNRELRETMIPRFVPERFGQAELIEAITDNRCNCVPYDLFKGYGSSKQLNIEENISMFGYRIEQAQRIVERGGRGNAACTGIAQIAIPAQKRLPNGQAKPYQGDWQAESFIRWGVSLGFIDYDPRNDTCKVSNLGIRFAESDNNSDEEKEIIGEALISYPPACRVLELLSQQNHLTKFEIGRQLGFIGEAGFTSVSQALYVGGISTAATSTEKEKIRRNFEGSSDKYARMIASWLCQIGWVARVGKEVTESYLGSLYTVKIGQSYMLTQRGYRNLNRIRGGARHGRSAKRVFWNMLATAAPDANYLRNRRYYTIQAIKSSRKTIEQIKSYLSRNSFEVNDATIIDDIDNFISIGLQVDRTQTGYLIKDEISCLEIPVEAVAITRQDTLSTIKEHLRDSLRFVNHRYLALLDLSYNGTANREFEIETMSLLTDELAYQGLHLGGSRRPDGLFYMDRKGVIVDTKAYSAGYSLPISQADEMIRYIEENRDRGNLNPNLWWTHFDNNIDSYSYLFVSSEFVGQFREKIQHIKNRTNYDGSVISSKNLLLLAESILSHTITYEDSFNLIRCNDEVIINM